eukprot:6462993-Amphidinium_carterae.1
MMQRTTRAENTATKYDPKRTDPKERPNKNQMAMTQIRRKIRAERIEDKLLRSASWCPTIVLDERSHEGVSSRESEPKND